jgi:lysophospholipid acyltransferase (LPLAT)-like uncharacterized protein
VIKKIKGFVLGFIVWILYFILSRTWKIAFVEPEDLRLRLASEKSVVFAHFHGDELVLLSTVKKFRVATLVSQSQDGEIMNTVVRLNGAKTTRGSSTRGGIGGLKALIQLCRNGYNCSFAVDGPKGPLHEVKPGVFETARLIRGAIYAGGVSTNRAWHFPKSWNKTFLPKPFARVVVLWQRLPIEINNETDPRASHLAILLKNQLFDARRRSVNLIAAPSGPT